MSISEFYKENAYDAKHDKQVQKLSLQIFDKLRDEYSFTDKDREIISTGALLHDIGCSLSIHKHNHYSYALIKNECPRKTFNSKEIEMIAQIALNHRGNNVPKPAYSKELKKLNKNEKLLTFRLSCIVRIADGLDRSHESLVKQIDCDIKDQEIIFSCTPSVIGKDEEHMLIQRNQ